MKKRTKMNLVLQYDDGLIYRLYGSSTAFRYDFKDLDWDHIRFELQEKPYVYINVFDSRVECPPQRLKLSKGWFIDDKILQSLAYQFLPFFFSFIYKL